MLKRSPKAGSVYKRADRQWVATVTLPSDEDGRRRRKNFYGQTELEAKSKRDEFLRRGGCTDPSLQTYLEEWLVDIKGTVADRTHADYTQVVTTYINEQLGHHRLQDLEPSHVRTLVHHIYHDCGHQRTADKIRVILRAALNDAVEEEIISRNVAKLVKDALATCL